MSTITAQPARRLFGTDGVRGVAGEILSADLALRLARAAALRVGLERPSLRALVIRDPRESGEMLEAAVAAGLASAGADVLLGHVLPTPAAPLLLQRHGLDLAVVLSASHNPYADNGIKFFGADGHKLPDEAEAEIEALLAHLPDATARMGRIRPLEDAQEQYLEALLTRFRTLDLSELRVVLDCANGATHRVAPEAFRRLGAEVTVLAADPDGRNINDDCGSTHPERLRRCVHEGGYPIGFAVDGDGDRVLAVDGRGELVDGDELIALAALHLQRLGKLTGNGVAVTVMTNYGFHSAMAEAGIEVAITGVGDRYVLEALRERGWNLGGEQSGHIIETGFNPTGDGIASALLVLEALAGSDLVSRSAMRKLPQRLENVRVPDREAITGATALWQAVQSEDQALQGRGRVLVRASGTEPLIRVMVEAPTQEEVDDVTQRLLEVVRHEVL